MPVYEYECLSCGKVHEIRQGFNDEPLNECPDCNGSLKKLISMSSFVLKGSGWYKTDYASGNGKKTENKDNGNGSRKDKAEESTHKTSV
jgi:putative FmdB family regulatory protein